MPSPPPPAPLSISPLRSLWLAVALSMGAAISLGITRFAYALLLPPMREDLGWSYTLAGGMNTALAFIEEHLGTHRWFAGEQLTMADFQMSFAVEAALARGGDETAWPHLVAYRQRMRARPAYQRALEQGGPVVMQA